MKFSCEKALLQNAVLTAARGAAKKSQTAELEGLLVKAEDESVTLTGYNLEIGITTCVPAEVREQGVAIIDAKLLSDIIKKSPDYMVTVETSGTSVHVKCGDSKYTLSYMMADNYPELPEMDGGTDISIPADTLKSMIHETIFCVTENEARPTLSGLCFETSEKKLTVVGLDGYRIGVRSVECRNAPGTKNVKFVAPAKALSEVETLCGNTDESVTVTAGSKHILFQLGDARIISRRLEGAFFDYKNAIPKEANIRTECSAKALLVSVNRVTPLLTQNLPIRCVFERDRVTVSVKSTIGDATDVCPISNGGDLEIGFNARYLGDALKYAPDDDVVLELCGPTYACVIRPADGSDKFLYLVLPVRLKAGV